ncbi:putative 26S proteasome regulatory subunit [Puttea exsequens]|nr:putative 26S proteasome regulatory subunit [Puttea exsequens]
MGLRMDDIHTPTVVSGPTSGQRVNGVDKDKLSLMEMISEKTRVEEELSALGSVLDSHGVKMDTSLTTFDGYPRDDIDIAQIRTTRARIIHLRNDYKALMSKIELGLHDHHAAYQASNLASTSMSSYRNGEDNVGSHGIPEAPFARVNSVVTGSPADQAGLKAGDRIRKFENVNFMNHERLSKIAEAVQRNRGRHLPVKISRDAEELTLQLTPRDNWGGRGLLGCHLVPL